MEAKLQQQVPQQNHVNKPNLTGIPTQMKLDFERRSGLSFDDVRVHYNSDKPAQLQALAYTQGTQVYVGPGQERHLKHELGHVVQQKQGRVKAEGLINNMPINMELSLEHEADTYPMHTFTEAQRSYFSGGTPPIQCRLYICQDDSSPTKWIFKGYERPSFSREVEKFLSESGKKEAREKSESRNHNIPYQTIAKILGETIVLYLNSTGKKPRGEVNRNKEYTKMTETELLLRQLVTMIIPKTTDYAYYVNAERINEVIKVSGKDMPFTNFSQFIEYNKQYRNIAKQFVTRIMHCLEDDFATVDGDLLNALVNELEFRLNSSFGNLRMADDLVNSTLGAYIDPIVPSFTHKIKSDDERDKRHEIIFGDSGGGDGSAKKLFEGIQFNSAVESAEKRMTHLHRIIRTLNKQLSVENLGIAAFYVAGSDLSPTSSSDSMIKTEKDVGKFAVFSSDLDTLVLKKRTKDVKRQPRESVESRITIKTKQGKHKKFNDENDLSSDLLWSALSKRKAKDPSDPNGQKSGPYFYSPSETLADQLKVIWVETPSVSPKPRMLPELDSPPKLRGRDGIPITDFSGIDEDIKMDEDEL